MSKYLFHTSQFFQSRVKSTIKNFRLAPSQHALKASTDDRYGKFDLPTKLPSSYEVIELEQTRGVNTKYVLRYEYDGKYDICIVIRPSRQVGEYTIVTAWLNDASDNHGTLNENRYNLAELIKY